MSEFTYKLPFTYEKFLKGIIFELKRNSKFDIIHLLKGASISIEEGGASYYDGGGRWNARATYITFLINPVNIDYLDTDEVKNELVSICNKLIPAEVGYDVKSVSFTIDLVKDYDLEDDLILDLEEKTNRISSKIIGELLPQDIKEKGYYMSEIYTYLYSVENSLRLFIIKVGGDSLVLSTALRNTIDGRKKNEIENKWLSIRGNEDIFYLDFKDLATIIDLNWKIFKKYFPDQGFIIPKIKEMAECRNHIAHNSYIEKEECNLIKTYYSVILKQISEVMG
ncbi:Swt1 family HEPN domain-containing protein [Clostridium beijerinckii]|uniref:Swt1 family HEPN domain-containing protein n=1 Tax=Clostridium beijerinckii TaxID=1520 RepID=UPI0022E47785|nr:Swt1 family HEPN domain-containing protein [Clostridium beijerinckii]